MQVGLSNILKWIVDDYNYDRPHISLNGLTPHEAYSGTTINKNLFNAQIELAKQERLTQNRKEICKVCE